MATSAAAARGCVAASAVALVVSLLLQSSVSGSSRGSSLLSLSNDG